MHGKRTDWIKIEAIWEFLNQASQPGFPGAEKVKQSPLRSNLESRTLRPLSRIPTLVFIALSLEEWMKSANSEEVENKTEASGENSQGL